MAFRSRDDETVWLSYIRVVYKHRESGQQLVQEFGDPSAGVANAPPQNLLNNPITKATWSSDDRPVNVVVDDMLSFRFFQVTGEETGAGHIEVGKKYTDDFSMWRGRVWLCGMDIHGEAGRKIWGIGPHWCYHEDYVVNVPPSPSPPAPSPPPRHLQ